MNVYKESDYRKAQEEATQEHVVGSTTTDKIVNTLGEIRQDFIQFGDALSIFPFRSALTVIGAITVAYIGFKVAIKFGSIGSELTKKLRS